MKKKSCWQWVLVRGVTILVLAICAAPAVAQTRSESLSRTLSIADRVAYQYAIEEVYWRHRIWPKENPQPKPLLDEVMSAQQIEKKVENYLRDWQALEDYGRKPISPEQLQAEMERIAQNTKQPEVLRELFAALGNDPFIIGECLARPILVERMVSGLTNDVEHKSSRAKPRNPVEQIQGSAARSFDFAQDDMAASLTDAAYKLPEISNTCTDDTWTATTTVNAPDARTSHTAVWTGSEMIIWGGYNYSGPYVNTGGRYDPATDTWTSTSTVNAPSARGGHTAVWTGREMIIWGSSALNTGGRYNPIADSWTPTTTANAPTTRYGHTAVWTGTEMIVWGGYISGCCWTNTGGRYNPTTNTWLPTSTSNLPAARDGHTAIWTGSEMIIWGGYNGGCCSLNTGGRYNPITNSWTATGAPSELLDRQGHTAVWTGSEMIVWGGYSYPTGLLGIGDRYDPSTDSWTPITLLSAPLAREDHTAVWTGSEMIVWGGSGNSNDLNTGGRYDPSIDSWTATSAANTPAARDAHTAIWTGAEMLVWGGESNYMEVNTGGRYCAPPQTAVLVADTANLTTESCTPPNGVPDPDETVTISFCVRNTGNGSTANLVGTLLNTGGVTDASPPQSYGVIAPGATVCRSFSFTANGTCGGTITASIQLQDGGVNRGTAMWSFPLGTNVASSENFDGVVPPALPPGWTVDQGVNTAGFPLWVTSDSGLPSPPAYSLPNAAYTEDPADILDNRIYSPVVMYAAGSQLTFRQNFDLEQQDPYTAYDAGVLEISVSGGGWVDIVNAGGSFASGGYNHSAINLNYGNPLLPNRPNWSGNSGGFITTTVNLPASSADQPVQFRWRMGSDNVVSRNGWRIDDVAIVQHICCTGPPTLTSAVSRKTHGSAGTFDVDLPLTGTPGIECRTGGETNDYAMAIIFSGNITVNGNPQAAVTSGTGIIGSEGIGNGGVVNINGNIVNVPLTNVANAQTINVTLYDVSDLGNIVIPMTILIGDTNGNGTVNASDIGETKSRVGQTANGTNFRSDVDATGAIVATDISIVKSSAGTGVP